MERVSESQKKAAKCFIDSVNTPNWSHDQFEAAVGKAFERKGYERLWGSNPRNDGGDADHVFGLPVFGIDELDVLDRTPLLIVQVKHKTGRDYNGNL